MRPKARGLTQHGGPPGWPEESDQAGCNFVRDGRSMPPALPDHTTCPGLGPIYYWMYTNHRHELRHARKAWPDTLVDPCLLSVLLIQMWRVAFFLTSLTVVYTTPSREQCFRILLQADRRQYKNWKNRKVLRVSGKKILRRVNKVEFFVRLLRPRYKSS